MSIFSKTAAALRRGVALLGVSAASSCRKMKLRVHIDTLNAEAEKLKAGVADEAYTLWKNGGDFSKLNARFESMDAIVEKIKDLEAQIKAADYESNEIFGWDKGSAPAPAAEVSPQAAEEEAVEEVVEDIAEEAAEAVPEEAFAAEEFPAEETAE